MANVTKIVRRGTSNLYDIFYSDGTAQTVYSSGTPDPSSTIAAPFNVVDRSGVTLQAFDDHGIGNKTNLPLLVYDGAGTLVKTLTAVSDLVPVRRVKLVLAGGVDTGAGVGVWQNPESVEVNIFGVCGLTTVIATSACTLDIGVTAANATTLSDNLIDGLDVHSALFAGFSVNDQAGANGKASQVLAPGKWLTVSEASGASAGLAGVLYFYYTLLD